MHKSQLSVAAFFVVAAALVCGNLNAAIRSVSVRDFKAAGDGITNDTARIQAALDSVQDGDVYFPAGRYAVCSISAKGKIVVLRGAGNHLSTIVRHSSCLQQPTNMVSVTDSESLVVRDLGFDQRGDGTETRRSALFTSQVNNVLIDGVSVRRGQSSGILIDRGKDIKVVNSAFEQCWWIGVAVGGAGTTEDFPRKAEAVQRIIIANNTFTDTAFGSMVSIFAYDTSITGNIYNKSSIGVAQATYRLLISGNLVFGAHEYGLQEKEPGIQIEAADDVTVADNTIQNPAAEGIFIQGSTLQIPPGTAPNVQLSSSRIVVTGNKVDQAPKQPIHIAADSPGGKRASQILVSSNQMTNSHSCITAIGDAMKISGNQCDTTTVAGYVLAGARNVIFTNNSARNIGTSVPGNYDGLEIANDSSQNIYVEQNEFVDDQSRHSMRYGVNDETLQSGHPSQVRYRGNTISGALVKAIYPAPGIPALGAWNAGDVIENPAPADGAPVGWICVSSGSPGKWVALGYAANRIP